MKLPIKTGGGGGFAKEKKPNGQTICFVPIPAGALKRGGGDVGGLHRPFWAHLWVRQKKKVWLWKGQGGGGPFEGWKTGPISTGGGTQKSRLKTIVVGGPVFMGRGAAGLSFGGKKGEGGGGWGGTNKGPPGQKGKHASRVWGGGVYPGGTSIQFFSFAPGGGPTGTFWFKPGRGGPWKGAGKGGKKNFKLRGWGQAVLSTPFWRLISSFLPLPFSSRSGGCCFLWREGIGENSWVGTGGRKWESCCRFSALSGLFRAVSKFFWGPRRARNLIRG